MPFAGLTITAESVTRSVTAFVTGAVVFALLIVVRHEVRRRAAGRAAGRAGELPALIADLAQSTKTLSLIVVALFAAALALSLDGTGARVLRAATVVTWLFQGGVWASHATTFWVERYRARRVDNAAGVTTIGAVALFARIGIWALLLLIALDNVGIEVTAIVAGLGIGGIAVALAAQSILGDLFSSLSIVLDKPFVVGDFIIVGSEMGTVEHVGLKTTRVRSLSGEQLVFANADILQSRIRNYKRMDERRVVFTIGVTYQTSAADLEAISEMLRAAIEAQERTRFDRAHFARFADSALEFEAVYYVLSPDYNEYMDIQQQINLEVFRRFAARNIEFAYPTRTLHLYAPGGVAEGLAMGAWRAGDGSGARAT